MVPAVRHAAHVENDRGEVRWSQLRGVRLNVSGVRRSPHAHPAIAVRKLREVLDGVVAVLTFANVLRELALGRVGAAQILKRHLYLGIGGLEDNLRQETRVAELVTKELNLRQLDPAYCLEIGGIAPDRVRNEVLGCAGRRKKHALLK